MILFDAVLLILLQYDMLKVPAECWAGQVCKLSFLGSWYNDLLVCDGIVPLLYYGDHVDNMCIRSCVYIVNND